MKQLISLTLVVSMLLPSFALADAVPKVASDVADPAINVPQNPADAAPVEKPASPQLIGWGNLLVPGLGATLQGHPGQGLFEAGTEIGLYYGGTFGVKEGNFEIDGSVTLPRSNSLGKPLIGQIMQEAGLKYHFYNTFYHYQQAVLSDTRPKREIDTVQPIYKGSAEDIALAPFHWNNLNNIWALPLVSASVAYLIYSYHTEAVTAYTNLHISRRDEALFGVSQTLVIPIGGLMGEEPLFRGFIMREARATTGSLWASLLLESTAFAAIHPPELRLSAFASGIYFGLMTNHFNGNLEPAIAAHFWVNVVSGVVTYFLLRREQGKNTPYGPPIAVQTTLPF